MHALSGRAGIAVRDDDDGDDVDLDGVTYDTTQVESDADEASGRRCSGQWDGEPWAIGLHSGTERDETLFGAEILSCAAAGDGFVAVAGHEPGGAELLGLGSWVGST